MEIRKYIIRNIVKSLIWLIVIIAAFVLGQRYIDFNYLRWIEPVYENTPLILTIFIISEIVIGIIPPEIFIIWALRNDILSQFIGLVALLAIVSYIAGIIGYFIGRYLNRTRYYRFIKRRFLSSLDRRLNNFGIYLIIIAAMTPLPFSGVSMLVGSIRYSFKTFLMFSLFRFVRFLLYGVIFWQTNLVG